MRSSVIAISGILVLAITACRTKDSNEKLPNIVLILCDDMGIECLSCNGAISYSTPNLDRLAGEGINFKMCFSQPICTPSRVKIMTGMYNYRNYVDFAYMDKNAYTFGNVLKKAGYRTAVAGKWQLNGIREWSGWEDRDRAAKFGFDAYCLWQYTTRGKRYPNPVLEQNGSVLDTDMDDYGPDICHNFLLDFMEQNSEGPFFVYYPMILVHYPFRPTPDSPEWQDSTKRLEDDTRYFKDMVEYTDKIVGRIDSKLEELGVRDNTILIFTGDNGTLGKIITETINGPYRGGKGNPTNAGTHVPLVINWPAKIKKGFETDCLVEFSDFYPTLSEAARVEVPDSIDGRSFFPLLTGNEYFPRETVFVHYDPKMRLGSNMRAGRFVRSKTHKLYYGGQFFNMENDPLEQQPLDTLQLSESELKIYHRLKEEMDTAPEWNYVNENFLGDLRR
jgi:arylsulfatase A